MVPGGNSSLASSRRTVMSSAPGWAGTLSCSVCKRERMLGEEFSKKQIEKRKSNPRAPLKCKSCVDAEALAEREQAAARKKSEAGASAGQSSESDVLTCACCKCEMSPENFSRKQLSKGDARRCTNCLADADRQARAAETEKAAVKLEAAREAARAAERDPSKSAAEKLAALSLESALEAQKVTGIAPARARRRR